MIHVAFSTHQSQRTVEMLKYWNKHRADRTSHCPSKWHQQMRELKKKKGPVESYLAKKQNKTVTFAGKWMELEVTMLSKICKSGEKKQIKGEITEIFEDKDRKGIRGLNVEVRCVHGEIA